MTEVCLRLGHRDEALLSYERIRDPRLRREAEHLLQRRGLLQADDETEAAPEPRSVRDDIVDATRVLFEDHMPLTTIVTTMTFPIVVGLGGFLTSTTSSSFLFPAIAALPALCVAAVVGGMSRRILIDAARGLQDPPRIPQVRELSRQSGRFLLDALVLTLVFLGPAIALACVQGLSVSTLVAAALGAFLLPAAMAIRQLTDDWRALSPNYLFPAVTALRGDYAATAGVCTLVALPAALSAILTAGSQLYLQASVVGPLAVAPLFFASRLLGLMVYGNRETLRELLLPRVQPATAKPTPAPVSAQATAPATKPETSSWSAGLARPTMRTTTATPPRVAAVPRKPRPDQGPLPTTAPRPALKAAAPTPAPADAPRAPAIPAAEQRPAASRPLAKPAPVRAATPAPRAPQPAPTPPNREAVAGRAGSAAPQPPAKRPAGGTHRAVGAAANAPAVAQPAARPAAQPAARTVAEPHPAPAGLATDQATKTRVAVTDKAPPDFTQMPGFNVVKGAARVLSGAASKAGGKRR
ncbi:MAG: hypothetical protein R3F56_20585 [Planctomycetota bacterium]